MTPCTACSFPHAAPTCPRCGCPATFAGHRGPAVQAPFAPAQFGQSFGIPPVHYAPGAHALPVGGELNTHNIMILAIVGFLFCQPAGIIAVILAEEAKKLHRQGRPEDAQRKLGHARVAVFIGLGLMALFVLGYIALMVVAMILT